MTELMNARRAAEQGERPVWALMSGVGLTGLVLTAALYFKESPGSLVADQGWHDTIVATRAELLTLPAKVIDIAANFGLMLAALALVIRWACTGRRMPALFLFSVMFFGQLMTQSVKHYVLRPRPLDPMVHVDTGSFPSGHVMGVMSLTLAALLLLRVTRRTLVLTLAAAITVIVWNRTYLGAHWITDALAGALLGLAVTSACWWAFAPKLPPNLARPS